MNVVDSTGWLAYFADNANAEFFAEPIEATDSLMVPTLNLFEVFKRVTQLRGESNALQAVAVMQQGRVEALTSAVALLAARLSAELKLPMADSVILATARTHEAVLWTQDTDFEGMPDVRYRPA